MVEALITRLVRKYAGQVIEPFVRHSLLPLFIGEDIGGLDVLDWARKILKDTTEPIAYESGGDWQADEENFDLADIKIRPYDLQKRITMNKTQLAIFSKNGIMPAAISNIGKNMAMKGNKLLCVGPAANDRYYKANYQYITAQNASSTSYANASLATQATAGVMDAAGIAQKDCAGIIGNLERRGYNPGTSILFYPEVVAAGFRRPIVTASATQGIISVRKLYLDEGIMGVVPVKDSNLPEANAGATPTAAKFDTYLVDIAEVRVGYNKTEAIEAIYDPMGKKTALDAQIIFTPLFIPKKYDTDGYIYKGESRLTACDLDT